MAKKKIDDLTNEEVEGLTDEQIKELEEKGEIEISDTPSNQPPLTDEEGDAPQTPEGEKEGEKDQSLEEIKKRLEQLEQEREQLRREKEGILRDLIEERQKRKQLSVPEQQEKKTDPLDEVLSNVGDEDFVDGKNLKNIIKEALRRKEEEFAKQVEERVNQIQAERFKEKIEESRRKAEQKYKDYTEKINAFFNSISSAEAVLVQQQLLKSLDPAEECYQMASRFLTIKGNTEKPVPPQAQTPPKQTPKILGGSGGASSPKITPDKLLKMSDTELRELERKNPELLRQVHKQLGEF